jgi:hypothetical protein
LSIARAAVLAIPFLIVSLRIVLFALSTDEKKPPLRVRVRGPILGRVCVPSSRRPAPDGNEADLEANEAEPDRNEAEKERADAKDGDANEVEPDGFNRFNGPNGLNGLRQTGASAAGHLVCQAHPHHHHNSTL